MPVVSNFVLIHEIYFKTYTSKIKLKMNVKRKKYSEEPIKNALLATSVT